MNVDLNTRERVPCLIIGAGPGGYTAAIYVARANLKPVLYQGVLPGGQISTTTTVENYPGYPSGILGPRLMEDFALQAANMGAELRNGTISKVDITRRPFLVQIDEETWVEADALILATGALPKWLGIENEDRLHGNGVSACGICDGFFFKNQDVAIVGAGDTACEEAIYLSRICSKVYMLVRKNYMKASQVMQDRVKAVPNIEILYNTEPLKVIGENKVEGVHIRNTKSNTENVLTVKAFFVAIGHIPNSNLFTGQLSIDHEGYVITKPNSTKTSVEGVFACGDVQDRTFRQAVVAAGSGAMAAMEAIQYLNAGISV
ncbi:thioredoxin-disulfide reductase [Niastella yeongjuensis]|uniref:Thioredoxin reductase n=1 Tax=Niastella yeongjuensis TaxID=354355 RepID=A0A1V9E3N9_9BACT|nr:thioredoxin-disulfide reductase [Niastella yeongjuensis]OQP40747.1 thioredoxin-disulfide reductase [Niastella yeongjuensis]